MNPDQIQKEIIDPTQLTPEQCIEKMYKALEEMQKLEHEYSLAKVTPQNIKRKEKAMIATMKSASKEKTSVAKEDEVYRSDEYEKLRGKLFVEEANAILTMAKMDRLKLEHATAQSTLSYLKQFQIKTT